MTLRVGVAAIPAGAAAVELVREADRLGVDSVWVPEFWAGDALTLWGPVRARPRLQRPASDGRLAGVRFDRPVRRTRETIDIPAP